MRHKALAPRLRLASANPADDGLVVCDEPLVSMDQDSFDRALDLAAGAESPWRLAEAPATIRPRVGMGLRTYLRDEEGVGHWDFFRLHDHIVVSVTDATYCRDHWVRVSGANCFKIRLLLSGSLLGTDGTPLVTGPQGHLHVTADHDEGGYFIAARQATRMVVLHCRGNVLSDVLGLESRTMPAPFDRLFDSAGGGVSSLLSLNAALFRSAHRIVESRHDFTRALRAPFIEAVAMEIICQVIGEQANRDLVRASSLRLRARDINRIYEAHDYLSHHYVAPPRIPQLARLVGVNQTKLKAGFKEVFGMTIYDYVIEQRMKLASELLLSTDCSVSEVAYEVGYQHPANFTCAFKKHFHDLPRRWRRT